MSWIVFTWLGCPRAPVSDGIEGQCDREVIALKEHLEMAEGQLAKCSAGDAPNSTYPELKQVFSGSDVTVDKEGTATRLTVRVSTIFADPYLLKFRTEADQNMDLLAIAIQRNPDARVMILGHTNDRPLPSNYRRAYSTRLEWSARLAGALAQRFVTQFGCDEAQFVIGGRGEHSPVQSNDLEAGRDANQRLEIWLYPPTDAPPAPE